MFKYIEGLFKIRILNKPLSSFSRVLYCYFLIKYSIAECTKI